ncbi:MAG TPA: response regulator, partial [Pyrinomonadaceae bacterium]
KGYRVVEAVNGKEAVELASTEEPGLVLMDLSMPVLDGYEATRRILAQDGTRDLPIVAVSAFCDGYNQQQALEAGCVECLGKPLDFGAISRVVERYAKVY